MELAYMFEKCLKLLPWLQDLHSFLGGWGDTGSGKGKRLKSTCGYVFFSVLSLLSPRL